MSGITQTTLAHIEGGKAPVKAATALRLAMSLQVKMKALVSTAHPDWTIATTGYTDMDGMSTMKEAAHEYIAAYRATTKIA